MENWLIKIWNSHICDDGQFNGCHMWYWNNKIKKKERDNLLCPMWLAIEYIRYYWIVWEQNLCTKIISAPICLLLLLAIVSLELFNFLYIKKDENGNIVQWLLRLYSHLFIFHSATTVRGGLLKEYPIRRVSNVQLHQKEDQSDRLSL